MTIGEILDLVEDTTQRADKRELAGKILKLGIKEVARTYDWESLRSVVTIALSVGQYEVSFPTRTLRILELRLVSATTESSSTPLQLIPQSTLLESHPAISLMTSGTPCQGSVQGNVVTIVPPCNSTDFSLQGTVISEPAEYTSEDEAFPLLGLENLLASYVIAKLFLSVQRYQDYIAQWNEYQRALRVAIEDCRRKPAVVSYAQGFSPIQVPVSSAPWYDWTVHSWR